MIRTNEAERIESVRLFALFPLVMTILDPYALTEGGGLFLCDILAVFLAVYLILKNKCALYRPLLVLLAVDFMLTVFAFILTDSSNTSLGLALKVAIAFLLYLLVYSSVWIFDIRASFYQFAEAIGLLCAVLAILQFVFASMGMEFYDGRLFFPLGEGSYFGGLYDKNTHDLRVHSFFEEPSYLAFFEIPITIHLIQEKKYIKAVICGISCILSGSMTGILGLFLALAASFLFDRGGKQKHRLQLAALILLVVIAFIFFYNTVDSLKDLIDYYVNRISNIGSSSRRENSSFSQRIFGNIALFSDYNSINKIIGVGFNQYPLFFGINKDYSNDFVSNLLNFGYIGLLFMIGALFSMIRRSVASSRTFILIFIMLLAVDHSWFGTMFFYLLTWIVMKSETNQKDRFLKIKF